MTAIKSNPCAILEYLAEKFGSRLHFSVETFPIRIQAVVGSGEHAIAKILKGQTKTFRSPTSAKLVKFFAAGGILLKEDWFGRHSLEQFQKFVETQEESTEGIYITQETVLHLPYFESVQANVKWRETLNQFSDKRFLTYRYAFEDSGRIARELLHFSVVDEQLRFSYYFRIREQDGDQARHLGKKSYRVCEGEAISIGESVLCVGVYYNPESGSTRFRALNVRREDTGSKNKFRHGIMLSETPSTHDSPNNPVSGKVLLERVDDLSGPVMTQPTVNEIANSVEWLTDKELADTHDLGDNILELIKNDNAPDHKREQYRSWVMWQNTQTADGKLRRK